MIKNIKTFVICLLSCLMFLCFFACSKKDEEPTVSQIAMAETPKTEYFIGDSFEITGAKIKVTYSNSATEIIEVTMAMVTVPDLSTEGNKTVTITYCEKTTTYQIVVSKDDSMLLAEAKKEALIALEDAFAQYDETDYIAAKWILLEKYYTDAKIAIDSATTINDIVAAKFAAINGMAEILTEDAQIKNFNAMVASALEKLNSFDERNYSAANLEILKEKIAAHTAIIKAIVFTGDDEADETAIQNALSKALTDIATIKVSYQYIEDGVWTDSTGDHLTEVTENLPDGLTSAYLLNYDGKSEDIVSVFNLKNGFDTTDIVENCGGGNNPTVVFTFWLYVEDASKLIGSNNSIENGSYTNNGAGLNVYMGKQKNDSSEGRAFYLDGKWFKKQTIGALVSGWNKISIGTGTSGVTSAVAENIVISIYKADADLSTRMMISEMRVEYLDVAQTERAAVVEKVADIKEIKVKKCPTNVALDLNVTEYIPEGGVITIVYSDKSEKDVEMTAEMLTLPDTTSKGYKEVTVSLVVRGICKTTTFEVSVGITLEDIKQESLLELENAYAAYSEKDYLSGTWEILKKYYETAKIEINNAQDAITAKTVKDNAISAMAALKNETEYTEFFKDLKAAAIAKLVLPADRSYTSENLKRAKEILDSAVSDINGLTANGNESTDIAEIDAIVNTALSNLSAIASWINISEGKWSGLDGSGSYTDLISTTENLPAELSDKPVYVLNNATEMFAGVKTKNAMFTANKNNLIDTTDLLNYSQAGGTDKPTVVFTFWLYISDVGKLKGDGTDAAAYLNAYVGNSSTGIPDPRGFYLDGKWFKTAFSNNIVSGWNKISIGTGQKSSSNVPGEYPYLNIMICEGTGTDIANVTFMIADLRIEYLASEQSNRLAVVDKIGDLSSIEVSKMPTNTILIEGAEQYVPENGILTLKYTDGKKEEIDLTAQMCTVPDLSGLGNKQIIVTYTVRGITKTTTFQISVASLEEAKDAAIAEIEKAYEACAQENYNANKWQTIVNLYTNGKNAVNEATSIDDINEAKSTAVNGIKEITVSYKFIKEGVWTDASGNELTKVTENLPAGIESAYILNYDGSSSSFSSIFKPINGIDTKDLVENCGGGNNPMVVFTFWLYVEDASKLIGTNGNVTNGDYNANGSGLNIYMGAGKSDLDTNRAFYFDGKWFKQQLIGSLVSGWNKISIGTGASGVTSAVAENIVFTFYQGADSSLNTKIMIADLRVEYLEKAQSDRVAVVNTITDATYADALVQAILPGKNGEY